jgi:hypothetical protein
VLSTSTCASEVSTSVKMAKKKPRSRSVATPTGTATSTATSAATGMPSHIDQPSRSFSRAAAYTPAPRKIAAPKFR